MESGYMIQLLHLHGFPHFNEAQKHLCLIINQLTHKGDIHCVRDAVIRGDRSIINNLEKATKISNDNMKKMVEWSTEVADREISDEMGSL